MDKNKSNIQDLFNKIQKDSNKKPKDITYDKEMKLTDNDMQNAEVIIYDTLDKDKLDFLNLSGRQIFYNQSYYGQDIIVAVLDTGCDPHIELEDRLLQGVSFVTNDNSTLDGNGHGSHVSCIIAGKNTGIAPKVQILPIKVLDCFGCGNPDWLINALKLVNGILVNGKPVDIVSMSLSIKKAYFDKYPEKLIELQKISKELKDNNIITICAAGNTGIEEILYPAYLNEVVTVGAVDKERKVAWFSTKSNEVDLCQVGINVLSGYSINKYTIKNGTSMSTPIVAGIAALLACKYKKMYKKSIKEEWLYEMLKMNTVDVGDLGIDKETGAGFCTLNGNLGLTIEIYPDTNAMYVNGVLFTTDAPPFIYALYNRIVLGVRDCAEIVGGMVTWDAEVRKATICL